MIYICLIAGIGVHCKENWLSTLSHLWKILFLKNMCYFRAFLLLKWRVHFLYSKWEKPSLSSSVRFWGHSSWAFLLVVVRKQLLLKFVALLLGLLSYSIFGSYGFCFGSVMHLNQLTIFNWAVHTVQKLVFHVISSGIFWNSGRSLCLCAYRILISYLPSGTFCLVAI